MYLSMRVIGLIGGLVLGALFLLPPKYFLLLFGVVTVGLGVWWLMSSVLGGVLCIAAGVFFVVYGVKLCIRASEQEAKDAQAAIEDAQRSNRLPF